MIDQISSRLTKRRQPRLRPPSINIKWFDGIGEYKINFGPGYRIYLVQEGKQLIILLGGGTKNSQQSDIKRAIELNKEYKKRKKDSQNKDK
jgi:putative addiction module killer protein